MIKTKIYLVRHAEVENPKGIYYVWLPHFGLSKTGYFQAERLKEYFSKKDIDIVYTSPLLRAKKTAKIIAGENIPLKTSRKIIEANYKHWQGIKIKKRPLSELRTYINKPEKARFLGESIIHVQKRVVRYITRMVKKYPGKNIVIVSHADPIISAKLFFEKRDINDINKVSLKNASISTLTFEGLNCIKVNYEEIVPAKEDGA